MLDLTKLPIGTKLMTRDGRSARLLATDLRGHYPCAVAIERGDGFEGVETCLANGRTLLIDAEKNLDIVSIEEAP